MWFWESSRGVVAALVLGLALVPARPGPPPSGGGPFAFESFEPEDRELLRTLGEGRLAEAIEAARRRIASRRDSCTAYHVLLSAAEARGELDGLEKSLANARRARPDDIFLSFAHAQALDRRRQPEKALEAAAVAVRGGVACSEAYLTYLSVARRLGRLDEAEELIVSLLRRRGDDPFLLFSRAHLWDMRGHASRALYGYQEALLRAPPIPLTYLQHATLMMDLGRYDHALFSSRIGATVARRIGADEHRVELLSLEATALELLGRESESGARFEEALRVARSLGLGYLEANVLLDRALLMESRGRPDAFERYRREAVECERRLVSPSRRAVYLHQLSRSSAVIGDTEGGAPNLRAAKELAAQEGLLLLELDAELGLAQIDGARGELGRALDRLQRVLAETTRIEDGRRQSRALSALGAVEERMGNYRRSLGYYRLALALDERAGNRRRQAIALSNIALIHLRLGESPPALVYSVRASEVARALREPLLEASLLQSLAATLAGLGNYAESERAYRSALAVSSRFSTPVLRSLILAGLARVILQSGNVEEAERRFEEALHLARSSENSLVTLQALSGLAYCAWRRGDLEVAAGRFDESVELVESLRESILVEGERIHYLETRSDIYASFASVLLALDRKHPKGGFRDRAFRIVERSKARTLLDILASSSREEPGHGAASWITGGARDPLVTPGALRAHTLEPGELLVEFSLSDPQSYLWLISRDDLAVITLPPRSRIEEQVRSYLATIAQPPRATDNPFDRHVQLGKSLFDTILGPVAGRIAASRRLIVAPEGILYHLPFEALVFEPGPRYLLDVVPIAYVPSASVLSWLRQRTVQERHAFDFLGVAQPEPRFPPASSSPEEPERREPALASIPFAGMEVEQIAALFPPSRRRTYSGAQATERRVKQEDLSQYRVLHFAAHAIADELFPERSAILLGREPGGIEDGRLGMGEVLSVSLDADLVVLSGCETALGPLFRAEGILGFSWAFLSAGSSSVLVSLWNVNDRSTSELMKAFYEQLRSVKDKGEALRRAKAALMRSPRRAYRHPYFWAPFVLVGRPS